MQPYIDDEEDFGYVELTNTGFIIPSGLPPGIKFDIMSAMIQLLNMKGVSARLPADDADLHFANFIGIYSSYTILEVN